MSDMTSADFYLTKADGSLKWLGSLFRDGAPAEMDDVDLFGPAGEGVTYNATSFEVLTDQILTEAVEEDVTAAAIAENGDGWPWPYATSAHTDVVYVYVKGAVQVFRSSPDEHGNPGQFLSAVHYPNGARKPTAFPTMAVAR